MTFNKLTKTLMALSLISITGITNGLSVQAIAQKPATSYVHYSCEPDAHFFSVNSIDYRVSEGSPPQSENFFLNSTQKDKPQQPVLVSDCTVAQKNLTLERVFLHVPNNSGNLCGTLDWGVFQLKADGKLISEFISGCSLDIHVFTNEFNLHVCKSDFNATSCKTLSWQYVMKDEYAPVRIGLLGNWL